jgi:uncharacterized protein with PIN domain
MKGSYYLLPSVILNNSQSVDDNSKLFHYVDSKPTCIKCGIPLVNVGVYDDEEEYNQEHATSYHWVRACPNCFIADWIGNNIQSHQIRRRNFTLAELQREPNYRLEPRPLSPRIVF